MKPEFTESELVSYTLQELRDLCYDRGLKMCGTKMEVRCVNCLRLSLWAVCWECLTELCAGDASIDAPNRI